MHAIITTAIYMPFMQQYHTNVFCIFSVPVRMGVDGQPIPESVPLANRAPGLPSYNEALTHSGQHDAPPPPYSG